MVLQLHIHYNQLVRKIEFSSGDYTEFFINTKVPETIFRVAFFLEFFFDIFLL